MTGLKMRGKSSKKPRPPARSGWVGTRWRSRRDIRHSSTAQTTRRHNQTRSSTANTGRNTYRNHHPANPYPILSAPPSLAQISSWRCVVSRPMIVLSTTRPKIAPQAGQASRNRSVDRRIWTNRGLASSVTSPEVAKYRTKSCGIRLPAISANTSNGIASRQRTWTPKCWSMGSGISPGKTRRQYNAQIARGSHVTSANTRHRRTIPSPLAGMSPTARCRRNQGSPRTKEKVSSSAFDWVSLTCAPYSRPFHSFSRQGAHRLHHLAETKELHNFTSRRKDSKQSEHAANTDLTFHSVAGTLSAIGRPERT